MIGPLFGKIISDLRGQIFGWSLAMGFLLLITVLIYPSIADTYGDMVGQLPEGLTAFFGTESKIDSIEGYLRAEFFNYGPLALSVFAILSGSSSIVGEEDQGTLEILMAQPISRGTLIFTKMAGMALANGVILSILLMVCVAGTTIAGIDASIERIVTAFGVLWPFLTTIAFLSLALSLFLSNRLFSGTMMAVYLVGSYILDSLGNLLPRLHILKYAYFTSYNQSGNALTSDISLPHIAGLLCILLLAAFSNYWMFSNRDISVGRVAWYKFPNSLLRGRNKLNNQSRSANS